jgi:hypothetical protein
MGELALKSLQSLQERLFRFVSIFGGRDGKQDAGRDAKNQRIY